MFRSARLWRSFLKILLSPHLQPLPQSTRSNTGHDEKPTQRRFLCSPYCSYLVKLTASGGKFDSKGGTTPCDDGYDPTSAELRRTLQASGPGCARLAN